MPQATDGEIDLLDALDHQHCAKCEDHADHQAADGDSEETDGRGAGAERAGQCRSDGEAEQHEPGCIIDEALALQQHDDPVRQRDLLQHRFGGDGIRRRNDRAERETGGPWQVRYYQMRDDADDERGEEHCANRKLQDDA